MNFWWIGTNSQVNMYRSDIKTIQKAYMNFLWIGEILKKTCIDQNNKNVILE